MNEAPKWPGSGADIFVVGCPRSGTTWLQAVLSTHSNLVALPESEVFEIIGSALRDWNKRRRWSPDVPRGLEQLLPRDTMVSTMGLLWFQIRSAALAAKPGATRVLEKTPHHIWDLAAIREVCGPSGALIVVLVRDPRDTIRSLLEAGQSWAKAALPDTIQGATSRYLTDVALGLEAADEDDVLLVRYEDLQQGCTHWDQLLTFLSLEDLELPDLRAHPASLSAGNSVTLVDGILRVGSLQIRQGHSFHDRQREQHRPLSAFERRYIEWRCRALMSALDYPGSRRHLRVGDVVRLAVMRVGRKLTSRKILT